MCHISWESLVFYDICDGSVYDFLIAYVFAPSGHLVAFFALMEQLHARRKQVFRWAHLLMHTLGMLI